MERSELLERLHRLEQEIATLRDVLEPPAKRGRLPELTKRFTGFMLSYWTLLSFLLAIATVIYVQLEFGVDYFETYRNISSTKKLGTFYRDLGERMMVYGEWKAAKDAYQSALELNPNDSAAALGAVKAQVFEPLEGETIPALDVANARLAFLLEKYPDDYQVFFLKGYAHMIMGDMTNALAWFQKSVDRNPNFVGGYLSLGYAYQGGLHLKEAVANYAKALELDPSYSLANNNLGFCYILQTEFEQAIMHLERSYSASPTLLTAINLGDAYRYAGDLNRALAWHQLALKAANEPQYETERYTGGAWIYNYMPLNAGDEETIKNFVQVYTIDQKRAFAHYALSFDHVLSENFEAADKEFNAGFRLDKDQQFAVFFINKMKSIEGLLNPNDEVRSWLRRHEARLLGQ